MNFSPANPSETPVDQEARAPPHVSVPHIASTVLTIGPNYSFTPSDGVCLDEESIEDFFG
jgi:hypothetical protein